MKVEKVLWFNTNEGCIGIVLADNGHEKKAYIKQVKGHSEVSDIKDVLQNGSKIMASQAKDIFNHLKA